MPFPSEPRISGASFTITPDRLAKIASRAQMPEWEVVNILLDHPWPNERGQHQDWIDTTNVWDIAWWVQDVGNAEALTQVMPDSPVELRERSL